MRLLALERSTASSNGMVAADTAEASFNEAPPQKCRRRFLFALVELMARRGV